MERQEINIENYKTVFDSGAVPGDIICGIGYLAQDWLGLHLVVLDEIKPGERYLEGSFRIIDIGNMVCDHYELETKLFLSENLTTCNLSTTNFTKIENIWPVTKRFKVGDTAKVSESRNSYYKVGDIVEIYKISKYPDERVKEMTYYKIHKPGDEIKEKLDSGLERF